MEEGGERPPEKEETRGAEKNEEKTRSGMKEDTEREDAGPDREEPEPRKRARAERGGEPKPATADESSREWERVGVLVKKPISRTGNDQEIAKTQEKT
ncbi:hypothetical protein NDU88_001338 [Pleurodeles waltl]|uniref:Uncharacterized protein n=1 Tax=Pleurodeles waltl TaxID=8319 RepID=A0AAV7WM16_PLEWA|nr:hypothetical protein NDU88_001338 [Pleurodeles waltl]